MESTVENIGGKESGTIKVQVGARLLKRFSEQLYSSPQKAFEELVSNGWDAGASYVDIYIPDDLSKPDAVLSIFDNGASMNMEGLEELWRIGISPKTDTPKFWGRSMIGQFGIGKLATYVLANEFTFICKANDGKIRRVTMDYKEVDEKEKMLMHEMELKVYEVSESDVELYLTGLNQGEKIIDLIKNKISTESVSEEDEFLAPRSHDEPLPTGTWTLVLLGGLKETGRKLKSGILRRMLRATLPLGNDITIMLNEEQLTPSKSDAEIQKKWIIGSSLNIKEIKIPKKDLDETFSGDLDLAEEDGEKIFKVSKGKYPVEHVKIEGVDGIITGQLYLFRDQISGGKSELHDVSNGFHVNILGRVVNQENPHFGEDNLSHSAWARFRMAVRADGLNKCLTVNREQFHKSRELVIFRAFLRKAFNEVRTEYDDNIQDSLTDMRDVFVKNVGVVSLNPLRSFISKALERQPQIEEMIDYDGVEDLESHFESWQKTTADDIRKVLSKVVLSDLETDQPVQYKLSDNSILINKSHPFVSEYAKRRGERKIVERLLSIEFLTDIYALDVGVDEQVVKDIMRFRDKLMRAHAVASRKSPTHVAKLLEEAARDSDNPKKLEIAVSAALECLGFDVVPKGGSGAPDGIASAYPFPSGQTVSEKRAPLYSFVFDAKSTKHANAKTGNIRFDATEEHRIKSNADYALIVAPEFQDHDGSALRQRVNQQPVTLMRVNDLIALLQHSVVHGVIPLDKLQEIFDKNLPGDVEGWVSNLPSFFRENKGLTFDTFIRALEHLEGRMPDKLTVSIISLVCRDELSAHDVRDGDVNAIVTALEAMMGHLISINNGAIIINVRPEKIKETLQNQIEQLNDRDSEETST